VLTARAALSLTIDARTPISLFQDKLGTAVEPFIRHQCSRGDRILDIPNLPDIPFEPRTHAHLALLGFRHGYIVSIVTANGFGTQVSVLTKSDSLVEIMAELYSLLATRAPLVAIRYTW
jgi:hypothetical protein